MARSGPTTKDTSTVPLGLAQIRVGNSATHIADAVIKLAVGASIGALANTKFTGNVDYWKLESGFPLLEDLSLPIREAASLECAFKELTPYNLALARGIDPSAAQNAAQSFVDKVTANGTTTGDISVPTVPADQVDVASDTFIVTMDGGDVYTVFGIDTGVLCAGQAFAAECAPVGSGGKKLFTIPAGFFTGTWLADECYTFKTTAYVADGGYSDAHSGTIKLGALKAPDFIRMEAVYTYPNQINHMYVIFPRANVTSSAEVDWAAEDTIASPLVFEGKRADEDTAGGHSTWNDMPIGIIYFD